MLNNYLEMIFLGNLGLTSTVMLFELSNNSHITSAVIFTSTGIAFILSIGIIVYHVQKKLPFLTKAGAKLKRALLHSKNNKKIVSGVQTSEPKAGFPKEVTYTVIELTQPLLER